MKKFLALIALTSSILISACTATTQSKPTVTAPPKEPVIIHFVCDKEQTVTDIVRVGMRSKEGMEKANHMLAERFNAGDCAPLPGGVSAPVKKLIDLGPDFEGDHLAIVQLDAPGDDVDPYWSIIVTQPRLPGKPV